MISLFGRKKSSLHPVKIPPHCVLGDETASLAAKREAQLRWMHEHGVQYLGTPQARAVVGAAGPSVEASARVVDIRSTSPPAKKPPRRVDAA